jgi:hypothetical protein
MEPPLFAALNHANPIHTVLSHYFDDSLLNCFVIQLQLAIMFFLMSARVFYINMERSDSQGKEFGEISY